MTLGLGQTRGGGFHDLELVDHGVAYAFDFHQPLAGRGDHFGEAAEPRQQGCCAKGLVSLRGMAANSVSSSNS